MVVELAQLRDKVGVFSDRRDAGSQLATMLDDYKDGEAIVLAIPSGGVPVGVALAEALGLPLDAAVVSKITLPWNSEAGFGAVAFDGTVNLNDPMLAMLGLHDVEKRLQIEMTRQKVERRVRDFHPAGTAPKLSGRDVLLVDDGIASGFTMLTAVEAIANQGAERIVIAVPTAHTTAIERVADRVEAIYCANVRGGGSFAVAAAYRQWRDVTEAEAIKTIGDFRQKRRAGNADSDDAAI